MLNFAVYKIIGRL